jgi:hypothetical protein
MKRSIGVTVIAVVSLAGSLLVLLIGGLMALAVAFASSAAPTEPPIPPGFMKAMLALMLVIYLAAAAWGITTSIGLLRLRNWARLSIIVFSVLLALMSGPSALMVLLMPSFPTPHGADASFMTAMRVGMGAFWSTILAIAIWWLVFFNRAKVKEQFVPAVLPPPPIPEIFAAQTPQISVPPTILSRPQRPLSFTILAWFLLIGCLFLPLSFAMHAPAILFTKMLTGLPAALYYLAILVVHFYIGIGLLRFKPSARSVGVGYYGFLFINGAVFYLAPGARARIHELFDWQFTMFPWMRVWQNQWQTQFDPMPSFIAGSCMGLAFLVIPLYFLISRKQRFERAAAARRSAAE